MKGLDLSEKYFSTYGAAMIKEKFSRYQSRIAAGLVGDGSECYGFDDEISRDHDWGPGFCLWVTGEDYATIGHELKNEYDRLPKSFAGYEARTESKWGKGRVGVFEIGEFYNSFIRMRTTPHNADQWLYIPENYLAACTNGKVFLDPLGEFSGIRNMLLDFYPEDVRILKIASRCMSCAQAGQYNFKRSVQRKEYFAAQYAETKFSADVISIIFLLNRRYTPFYKWMHRAVRSLPILGQFVFQKIQAMTETSEYERKKAIIEEISVAVIDVLKQEGLSESGSDFLLDHVPDIHKKIKNEKLRGIGVQ